MFNLGPEKILVILAIALVVLGPDKLPEAARKAGQLLGNLRRLSGGFEHEIRQALDEPMQAFHREFSAGETHTATSNGASGDESSGDASSLPPDPAVQTDGSGAPHPTTVSDTAPAESSPTTAADPPASPPPDEPPAAPANTPSVPSWVFGRTGDDSGPAFH